MDDLLRQVIDVYVQEVREQAQRIAEALLRMEENPATIPVEIEELYRQAHSLKGSSGSLGIADLEQLAHAMEQVLMPVRRANAALTPALVDLCLQAMAAAQERIPGLLAETDVGSVEVAAAIRALERTAQGQTGAAAVAGSGPTIDSSFEVHETTPELASQSLKPTEVATGSVLAHSENIEAVRISIEHLRGFERRSDELRALRGRLERHLTEVSQICQTLERVTGELRDRGQLDESEKQQRDELLRVLRSTRTLRRELAEDTESLQATTSEFDDNLRTMRLVPASFLVQPLTLAVREACRVTGRDAALEIVGDQVHIDRLLLEEVKNPLLHLVRNAIDHGIESREVREAIGKPARGRVQCQIEQHGGEISLSIHDDGRGIDVATVRKKAVERGLVTAAQADALSEKQIYDLLLLPGFSTTDTVTTISGRGVGLDVVKMAVLRMHGQLEIQSAPGRGTHVRITVPMTMAASRLMLFADRDWVFALPQSSVSRVALVRRDRLISVGGQLVLRTDGETIKVVRLRQIIGEAEQGMSGHSLQAASMPVLILRSMGQDRGPGKKAESMPLGILCERTLGESDLVLRALPPELQGHAPLSSVALLANGSAVFVLSAQALISAADALPEQTTRVMTRSGTVLVADDSITTRSLLRSVLEVSGYEVRTAADGDEALRLIANEPVSLIVSDVRMPRLDGLSLVQRLRGDARTASIPVVLFSSSDSEEDRRMGMAAGANAYLSKGAFERGQLIDVVRALLRGAA